MRSLLRFLALCAAVSLCVSYESNESTESNEELFVHPSRANAFIQPQRGNVYIPRRNGYNFRRTIKSPAEQRAEICEDFSPCRMYAYHHGVHRAYSRYFGARTQPQQPAVTRRQ